MLRWPIDLVKSSAHRIGIDVVKYPRWATYPWALQHILPSLRPQVVMDVGAHYGEFGQQIRRLGYKGWIVSLEPVAENYTRLCQAAEGDSHWITFPFAAGATAAEEVMHVARATDFSSFREFRPEAAINLAESMEIEREEQVDIVRLDELWSRVAERIPTEPRLFVKTDTQGFDLEVLAGLGDLRRLLVGVQLEVAAVPLYDSMPTLQESLNYLLSQNFHLAGLYPVSHNHDWHINEYDALFVKRESV